MDDLVDQVRWILDSAIDAAITMSEHGTVTGWNGHAETTFGWTREEAIGRDLSELIMPERYRQRHKDGLRQFLETGEARIIGRNIEIEALHRDGHEFHVELGVCSLRVGDQNIFSAFLRDISERTEREQSLRDSQRKLTEAQRVAHLGSWEWDIAENNVTWSEELHRIYGTTPEDFEASYEAFLERVHPDDQERVAGLVEAAYGGASLDFLHRLVRPDGEIRILHAHGELIRDDEGNPSRMVGTALDVTKLKEAEAEISKLNATLERRVAERTAELEAAVAELETTQNELVLRDKMAALGRLVAGVAHEINTPLGAIKSNHQTLKLIVEKFEASFADKAATSRAHDRLIESAGNMLDITGQAIERIAGVVSGLRRFTRLDQAEVDSIDIVAAINETLPLLRHETDGRITIHVDETKSPLLECYANQINQLLMNLLVNASQAIDGPGDIFVNAAQQDEFVTIVIRDTGRGIAPEDLGRVFDPGFTTKGVGVGTGLGLSIVHQIVEAHHGSIKVSSELGSGTTFRVRLPVRLEPTEG